MLFVYSDRHNCRLDSGGGTCLKHLSHEHLGVRTAFHFKNPSERR